MCYELGDRKMSCNSPTPSPPSVPLEMAYVGPPSLPPMFYLILRKGGKQYQLDCDSDLCHINGMVMYKLS